MDGRLLSLFLSPHLSDPFLQPTIPSVLICPLTRFIYVEQYFSVNKPWPTFSLENSLAAAAKSLQSCPTLCDPIDGSPLGSSVPGILQARILEWVAISFSNAWKWKVKMKSLSRPRLLVTPRTAAYQAPLSMGFSRQEYWSGVPLPSPENSLRGTQRQVMKKGVQVGLYLDQGFTLAPLRLLSIQQPAWSPQLRSGSITPIWLRVFTAEDKALSDLFDCTGLHAALWTWQYSFKVSAPTLPPCWECISQPSTQLASHFLWDLAQMLPFQGGLL